MQNLELLEQKALLRTLIRVNERNYFITELKKSIINPEGIGSLETIARVRENLGELGLIVEEIEEGPHPKTFLVITDKGRRVAQKILEIQDILEED